MKCLWLREIAFNTHRNPQHLHKRSLELLYLLILFTASEIKLVDIIVRKYYGILAKLF